MRIIEDTKYDFSDLLIIPKRSSLISRKDVQLEREYKFKHSNLSFTGIGIISSNMDHTGTFEMALELNKHKILTALHKHYSSEELIKFFKTERTMPIFYSMGMTDLDVEKLNIVKNEVDINWIHLDVPNGYTNQFSNFVKKIRKENPNAVIMAGAVVTAEMTEQLILDGADIVRCGIGGGSVCTTRKLTGVGFPQASAVIECASAAHGLGGHLCSDGGIQMPGDIAKAIGCGADFVMIGGMFAGHEECSGERITENQNVITDKSMAISTDPTSLKALNDKIYFNPDEQQIYRLLDDDKIGQSWKSMEIEPLPTHMKFYGMSSEEAMEKHSNGVADYRAPEGKSVLVPYRGKIANTIKEVLGGLRSSCTYTGSKTLKELQKRAEFVKVNKTHNTIFGDENQ